MESAENQGENTEINIRRENAFSFILNYFLPLLAPSFLLNASFLHRFRIPLITLKTHFKYSTLIWSSIKIQLSWSHKKGEKGENEKKERKNIW